MPSIFIWKSDSPNTSKKIIKVYAGSNWVLEDIDYKSKSYMYLEQIVISESTNSVITFHSRIMPQDWVGSELLEVSSVPYELIKSDNYGTLEMIGDWMRFTTNYETEFNIKFIESEIINIKKWMNKNTNKNTNTNNMQNKNTNTNNMQNKNTNTNNMQNTNTNTNNMQNTNKLKYNTINTNIFDSNKIQLDFHEFLNKYNLNQIQIFSK